MSAYVASSLEYARAIRAAIKERERVLAPVIEAYDEAVSQRDRWATATELCLAIASADRVYGAAVAAAGVRLRARDLAGDL